MKAIEFCIISFFLTVNVYARILDRVLAVVDGTPITLYEITKGKQIDKTTLLNILQNRIDEIVLLKKSEELGMKVTESDLKRRIGQIIKENKISEDKFWSSVRARGFSRNSYLKRLRIEMTKERIIQAFVYPKITVTDKEIQRRYRTLMGKDKTLYDLVYWQTEDRNLAEKIFKKVSESSTRLLKNKELIKGLDFSAKMGVLKHTDPDELIKEISGIIVGKKAGFVSPPLNINGDFIVVFILATENKSNYIDIDTKNRIRKELIEDKIERLFNNLLKKYREDMAIEILISS